MTWTYTDTLVADKDKVRAFSGDVLTTDQQVSDEFIAGMLTMYGNVLRAAAAVCRSLAARYSRLADQQMDDLRKSSSQRAKAYADRAVELEAQAASGFALGSVPVPYAGGISIADKAIQTDDPDAVQPFFRRDLMEVTVTPLSETETV